MELPHLFREWCESCFGVGMRRRQKDYRSQSCRAEDAESAVGLMRLNSISRFSSLCFSSLTSHFLLS